MSNSGNTQYFDAVSDCFSSTEQSDCTQHFEVEGCAAISIKAANYVAPMNLRQTEVTSAHGNENTKKPKNARKTKKRKVIKHKQEKSKRKAITDDKPKQGKADTHIDHEAQQYIGINVNLEYDGQRSIAFVTSYDAEKKLFQVEFKLEGRPTKYVEKNVIFYNIATKKDIDTHNEKVRHQLKKVSTKKKRKRSSKEGSTSITEIEKNTSSQKKKTSYIAPRKRAINDNRGP